ncbi:MAG: NUDIX domain-containing protein [Chloroflexota bacterium]
MTPTRYIVNVQGAIYHQGKYLCARRSQHKKYMAGTIGMPGGKTEALDHNAPDVTLATLHREIMEEVNVTVTDPHLVTTKFFDANDVPVINLVYLCKYDSGEAHVTDPIEVAEVMWLTINEILQHPDTKAWTHQYITQADALRQQLGW